MWHVDVAHLHVDVRAAKEMSRLSMRRIVVVVLSGCFDYGAKSAVLNKPLISGVRCKYWHYFSYYAAHAHVSICVQ